MAVIRNLQGFKKPLVQKSVPKGQPQGHEVQAKLVPEQRAPSESVALSEASHSSPQQTLAPAKSDQTPPARGQASSEAVAQTRAQVPSVLTAETPVTSDADDTEDVTNWVLQSVASTPYANDPSMEIVKKRYGTLSKVVRDSLTDPLLDAITTSDLERGTGKLKELADTANWAQKFKKDALKLVGEGGYEALSKKAQEAKQNGKGEKTRLDGVMEAKGLVFSSELPQHRAKEANQLLQQFANGNENPGIGSKALGKGISYLRGRKGTRLFYKKQGEKVQWLAVCDKSTEPKAIKQLQKEFNLS